MSVVHSSLVNIRRSPYQSLLAIVMMSITFFVAHTFALTLVGAENVLRFFETRPQVIAFFRLQATDADISSAVETVETKPYVSGVKLVSKTDALELYRKDNQDNPLLLELVTADILPASLEVSANAIAALPQVKSDLEGISVVEEVVFQDDVVSSLSKWTNSLRLVGVFVVGILGVTSFMTIVMLIGMKVLTKKNAINIMKIIGATNWYIISPFVNEGIIYGVFGSLIGWGMMYGLLLYLTPWLKGFLGEIITLPIDWRFLLIQAGAGVVIGWLLGIFASLVAVRRMIRR